MTDAWAPLPIEAVTVPFRSSGTRSQWAAWLVGVASAAIALEGISIWWGLLLLARIDTVTADEMLFWQQAVGFFAALFYATFLPAAIASLAWLSRVVDNIPALGGGTPMVSPRAAIGWWFVPIANFIRPAYIVADAWKRLAANAAQARLAPVFVWWVVWLGAGIVGQLLTLGGAPTTVGEAQRLFEVSGLALVIQAVGGVLFILIIRQIERRSEARAAAIEAAAERDHERDLAGDAEERAGS